MSYALLIPYLVGLCAFEPNYRIAIVCDKFRKARMILGEIENLLIKLSEENRDLFERLVTRIKHRGDHSEIAFSNGSIITAIPIPVLEQPLRGFRVHKVLYSDLDEKTMSQYIYPFISVRYPPNDPPPLESNLIDLDKL